MPTSLLRDESVWTTGFPSPQIGDYFQAIGDRGALGQSTSSALSLEGVMFFTQVHRDAISCWDSNKLYQRSNIVQLRDSGLTSDNNNNSDNIENLSHQYNEIDNRLIFPNDLKIRFNWRQEESVWIMSNRLPIYLYSKLNYSEINFRIMTANLMQLIKGTPCDPKIRSDKTMTLSSKIVIEGECY